MLAISHLLAKQFLRVERQQIGELGLATGLRAAKTLDDDVCKPGSRDRVHVGLHLLFPVNLFQHSIQQADRQLVEPISAELWKTYTTSGDPCVASIPIVSLLDDSDAVDFDLLPVAEDFFSFPSEALG